MSCLSLSGKHEKAASLLAVSGLLALSERIHFGESPLVLLAYHGIRDINPADYPFDEGTVSASCHQFDLQMDYVKKNFDTITFAQLKACREGKIPFPKRPIIITFDDGFADNYQNAFPILKKHGLPATIFLASGFIGTDEVFWWEKVAYWLKHSKDFFKVWEGLGQQVPSQNDQTQRWVLRYFKDAADHERIHILSEMEKQFPIEKGSYFPLIRPLRWDEVLEMSQGGIEFGSHTVTHPLLSKVPHEKLLLELSASKKEIEEKIGKEVIALAYPVGGPSDYNDEVISVAKQVGYLFGITYFPEGDNSQSSTDWFRMKRVTVEWYYSLNRFRSNVHFPRLLT
jgi:peptidoglycan/xylan/chitin deacetylase (PgdA/CDA1 family)